MKKLFYLVFILIGFVIILIPIFAYLDSTSIERPWKNLSCDEKMKLALDPEHQSFSDKQHVEFHKDLEKCMNSLPMNMQ